MEQQRSSGCLGPLAIGAAVTWLALLALSAPALWFVAEIQQISGMDWGGTQRAVAAAILTPLLVGPLLLGLLARGPRLRASLLTLLLAAGFAAALLFCRALPNDWRTFSLVAQTLILVIGAVGLAPGAEAPGMGLPPPAPGDKPPGAWGMPGARGAAEASGARSASAPRAQWRSIAPGGFAPGAGLLLWVPWLWRGALGSVFDTLLALAAGLALGALVAALLRRLLPTLRNNPTTLGGDLALIGVTVGGALLPLGMTLGWAGGDMLLLAALPPLGFGAAALALRSGPRAAGLFVGLAAAAPLALFDPPELSLILGEHDVLALAVSAARAAFPLGLLVSGLLALWALRAPRQTTPNRALGWGTLGGALVICALVYGFTGHPGLYGDRLFVILKDQANLTAARQIADPTARRQAVYTTLTSHADRSQADLRALLDTLRVPYTPYYLVNAVEVDGGPLLRAYLATRPEVDRIIPNPELRPLDAPPAPEPGDSSAPQEPEWNLRQIGADRVWEQLSVRGAGVTVGQIDTGVDGQHPALKAQYRNDERSWLDPWYGSSAPRDYGSHGTHTLGTILGKGVGVAPDAKWIGCVALARNLGSPGDYLTCMQFVFAPYVAGTSPLHAGDAARGAQVLNNSWGCPPVEGCDPNSLAPATAALRAAGVFVVASAGNDGPACSSVHDPLAIYADVLSVAALDAAGDLAEFSSRGPVAVDGSGRSKPDIAAPGVAVLSSTPGGSYAVNSGTSMAGPHVVGAVALLWSANPRLVGDIDRTSAILRETAAPFAGQRPLSCAGTTPGDNAAGAGVLDVYAAVHRALAER